MYQGLHDVSRQECIPVILRFEQKIQHRLGDAGPIRCKYGIRWKALERLVIAKHVVEKIIGLFDFSVLLWLGYRQPRPTRRYMTVPIRSRSLPKSISRSFRPSRAPMCKPTAGPPPARQIALFVGLPPLFVVPPVSLCLGTHVTPPCYRTIRRSGFGSKAPYSRAIFLDCRGIRPVVLRLLALSPTTSMVSC